LFKNKHLRYFPSSLITAAMALATVLATSACGDKVPPPAPPVPWVVTQKAQAGDAGAHASFAGEVRARSESALGFRVPGKIIARLVDVGTSVKAGTPLARIDARDLQLNSAGVRSQLAAAQADVVQAQADYTRYNDLFQKKFVSAAEIDKRKATLDVAQARLEQAKAQLSVADNQNTYATLVADRDGVITAVEAEAGQVVAAGQTVVRLAREAEKEILIAVPENRLPQLQAAQKIDITLWAAPDKRYLGRVREVSPSADAVTRTYAVRIAVAGADADMRLGMTASVRVLQAGAANAIVLPLTAIYQKGTATALWFVEQAADGTHTVKLVPVTVGAFREDSVTIVSGVKEGDTVVTAGVHKLTPGQKVRLAGEPARK
jgi:multidrug efflux system membrane fusion protein